MKKLIFSAPILLSIAGLTGCVSLKTDQPAQTNFKEVKAPERQATLAKLTNWNINGAFSLQNTKSKKNKVVIAAYSWNQFSRSYRIKISSSLNLYSLSINGRPGNVSLWKSAKKHYRASSPEGVMQKAMGWSLPISNLRYWVRGMPAPGGKKATYNKYGLLKTLNQQGWHIVYSGYVSRSGYDVPQTLIMRRGAVRLKIVVKHWTFHAARIKSMYSSNA